MGSAAVSLSASETGKPFEIQSSFTGPISSTAAELRGITVAQSLVSERSSLILLTDLLVSLHALRTRQRQEDFQYSKELPGIQQHLDTLVPLLNEKAKHLSLQGLSFTIAKIAGHSGDPLNDYADARLRIEPQRHSL